jgi:hypothetical protein
MHPCSHKKFWGFDVVHRGLSRLIHDLCETVGQCGHKYVTSDQSGTALVETHTGPRGPLSHGTKVTVSRPTDKSVSWRDSLFPCHLSTT